MIFRKSNKKLSIVYFSIAVILILLTALLFICVYVPLPVGPSSLESRVEFLDGKNFRYIVDQGERSYPLILRRLNTPDIPERHQILLLRMLAEMKQGQDALDIAKRYLNSSSDNVKVAARKAISANPHNKSTDQTK